jgi:hypothetical protein
LQKKRPQTQNGSPVQNVTSESSASLSAELKEPATNPDKNSNGWLSRQLPLFKVIGIISLLITGFVIAGRFISALAPRPLAIVIRIALFAALAVYLFKGYSEKIVDAFARIKDEGNTAQKAVDKRIEKIQQQAD